MASDKIPSSIANHPLKDRIDKALYENKPLRDISERFEVNRQTLHRYKKSGLYTVEVEQQYERARRDAVGAGEAALADIYKVDEEESERFHLESAVEHLHRLATVTVVEGWKMFNQYKDDLSMKPTVKMNLLKGINLMANNTIGRINQTAQTSLLHSSTVGNDPEIIELHKSIESMNRLAEGGGRFDDSDNQ